MHYTKYLSIFIYNRCRTDQRYIWFGILLLFICVQHSSDKCQIAFRALGFNTDIGFTIVQAFDIPQSDFKNDALRRPWHWTLVYVDWFQQWEEEKIVMLYVMLCYAIKRAILVEGMLPGGVLPYMGYIGMCGPKGYGFSAVLVINWVSILAILPPLWS